jgi:N-methylhydantoinase A
MGATTGERDTALRVRAGIDVGGTFTDAVLVGDGGELRLVKVPTTPARPAEGFASAVALLAERAGLTPGALDYLVHGTTLATNAIIEGRAARVGLITTAGFRDVLEIGTQQRAELYDPRRPRPAPLVPRELRLEVSERIGADGAVVAPLDEDDVRAAAATLRDAGVEAVAVVLLFSFLEPAHERRVGELLAEELPGVPATLSSRVAPEFREYVRTSTTALNAALLPLAGSYVGDVAGRLSSADVRVPLHLMQSNGGVMPARDGVELPIGLIASGPAGGVIGAARLGALAGHGDLFTFDMGGTTADVGIVVDGEAQMRPSGQAGPHPVSLPQIDVLSVGAGAGSIARVDAFGELRVGPDSAGADPGPAAYARGGSDATVTDAHVVLGTLSPDRFLGGSMRLDADAARAAVARCVAERLGTTVEEAAAGIIRIADAMMVDALRLVSVARGHDPRGFTLVAFGGAGAMHACALAEHLGLRRVLVPRHPGVGSAMGLLLADVRYDLRRTWVARTAALDPAALDELLEELGRDAAARLSGAGFHNGAASIDFRVDMRYVGQAYDLTVPIRRPVDRAALRDAEEAFHSAHERAYGHRLPNETEVVTVRARGRGAHPELEWEPGAAARGAVSERRDVWTSSGPMAHAVHAREHLADDAVVAGPAIVEQYDTTIVVPPGWRLRIVTGGSAELEREDEPR